MSAKVRESEEFINATREVYKHTQSLHQTARRLALIFSIHVSPRYVSTVLDKLSIKRRNVGCRPASIYDAQLGESRY